ncbi:hypothetical protein DOE73_09750 [Paenibacillus dendritiformis]|nr:hypothetical protein DOE73_09750 [Paenibacillus dendritiformis]
MAFQPGMRPVLSGWENGDKGYKTGWVDTGEAILTVLSEWENADKGKRRIAGLAFQPGMRPILSGWENDNKEIKSLDKWNSEAGKRVRTSKKERAGTSRNRSERKREPGTEREKTAK